MKSTPHSEKGRAPTCKRKLLSYLYSKYNLAIASLPNYRFWYSVNRKAHTFHMLERGQGLKKYLQIYESLIWIQI